MAGFHWRRRQNAWSVASAGLRTFLATVMGITAVYLAFLSRCAAWCEPGAGRDVHHEVTPRFTPLRLIPARKLMGTSLVLSALSYTIGRRPCAVGPGVNYRVPALSCRPGSNTSETVHMRYLGCQACPVGPRVKVAGDCRFGRLRLPGTELSLSSFRRKYDKILSWWAGRVCTFLFVGWNRA